MRLFWLPHQQRDPTLNDLHHLAARVGFVFREFPSSTRFPNGAGFDATDADVARCDGYAPESGADAFLRGYKTLATGFAVDREALRLANLSDVVDLRAPTSFLSPRLVAVTRYGELIMAMPRTEAAGETHTPAQAIRTVEDLPDLLQVGSADGLLTVEDLHRPQPATDKLRHLHRAMAVGLTSVAIRRAHHDPRATNELRRPRNRLR